MKHQSIVMLLCLTITTDMHSADPDARDVHQKTVVDHLCSSKKSMGICVNGKPQRIDQNEWHARRQVLFERDLSLYTQQQLEELGIDLKLPEQIMQQLRTVFITWCNVQAKKITHYQQLPRDVPQLVGSFVGGSIAAQT